MISTTLMPTGNNLEMALDWIIPWWIACHVALSRNSVPGTPKFYQSISSSTNGMAVNLGISPIKSGDGKSGDPLKCQFQCHVWLPESRGHLSNGLDRSVQFIFEAIRAPALISATWLTALGCRVQTKSGDGARGTLSSSCESRRNVVWKLKDSNFRWFHWFSVFKLGTGANSGPAVFNNVDLIIYCK